MYAGFIASVVGHVLLVLVLAVGLPELFPPEDKIITTNSVGVITEEQLAALSQPNLPPAREAGSSNAATAAAAAAADATTSQQAAEAAQSANAQDAAQSGANTAALTAADAARSAGAPDAAQSAADAASSAAAQTANAANAQTAQSAATATAASTAARNAQLSTTREATARDAAVRPLTPAELAANTPPSPEAVARAPRLPPRRPAASAAASTAPPTVASSQQQAEATTRAPTELAAVKPPPEATVTKPPELAAARPAELAAAKPPEAIPATPPETPDEPRPREVLAQTAVTRAEARRTRLPPRRLAHLDDPPDETPVAGTRQIAEAPQKATGQKPAKQDFFASMKSSIGAKPTAGGLDGVRKTLGVGIAGARVSASDQAALAKRLGGCWYKPDGQRNARDLIVELSVELDTSSNLIGTPRVLKKPPASAGAPGRVAVARAIQAVQKCAPFNANGLVLPPNSYSNWRTMRITFDPS